MDNPNKDKNPNDPQRQGGEKPQNPQNPQGGKPDADRPNTDKNRPGSGQGERSGEGGGSGRQGGQNR
jgi:hypothetical protein